MTWEETLDVAGCNLGPEKYYLASRDPERTPFQWDNTTSAGFSTNENTWLPVHENYKTLNLAAQKIASVSHYKVFKALTALKKKLLVPNKGQVEIILITKDVLGVVRRLKGTSPVVLLINVSDKDAVVDASSWLNIPKELVVYTASVDSKIKIGTLIDTNSVKLPGSSSVVLASPSQALHLFKSL